MDSSRFEPTKKLHSGLYPVNRMSNQLNKISPLSFFSWQLNAKKRFSISSIVFPQSSWEAVAHLKKKPKVVFFKGGHPSYDDYGKTIEDIEKCFFAFNCQLKKLNVEILWSWFDIRFTGYKPESNFLVGSNLGGPRFFFS